MAEIMVRFDDLRRYCEKKHCGSVPIEYIKQMHTIEAEPVRHGQWNYRHEDDWCYCTACGTDAEGSNGECLETDYCPHCGARMDAEDTNVLTNDGGADNG